MVMDQIVRPVTACFEIITIWAVVIIEDNEPWDSDTDPHYLGLQSIQLWKKMHCRQRIPDDHGLRHFWEFNYPNRGAIKNSVCYRGNDRKLKPVKTTLKYSTKPPPMFRILDLIVQQLFLRFIHSPFSKTCQFFHGSFIRQTG